MPRLKSYFYPLRDPQDAPAVCMCARCGEEIYDPEEGEVCRSCRAKLNRWDQKTAQAILEDFDAELQKYLSDDLRNAIWNVVAPRYIYEEG